MALPDFMVIGAPKAGSTAVHAALVQHPQLFLSQPKEPKFFMTGGQRPDRAGQRGPGDAHSAREWMWRREEYEGLFDSAPPGTLKGEATPFYLWDRDAHRRIADAVPHVKLIAVLRDPVDRAYSNWTHLRSDGLEPEADFLTACNLEQRRVAAGWAPFWRYAGLGRYGEQLQHLFEHVDRERVFVLRYRDLIDDQQRTLDAMTAFLGVETGLVTSIPHSNHSHWAADSPVNTALRLAVRAGAALGSYAPPQVWRRASRPLTTALHRDDAHRPTLDVTVRRELVRWFADDVALLENLLGRDFQGWLSDTGLGTYALRRSSEPSGLDASQ